MCSHTQHSCLLEAGRHWGGQLAQAVLVVSGSCCTELSGWLRSLAELAEVHTSADGRDASLGSAAGREGQLRASGWLWDTMTDPSEAEWQREALLGFRS